MIWFYRLYFSVHAKYNVSLLILTITLCRNVTFNNVCLAVVLAWVIGNTINTRWISKWMPKILVCIWINKTSARDGVIFVLISTDCVEAEQDTSLTITFRMWFSWGATCNALLLWLVVCLFIWVQMQLLVLLSGNTTWIQETRLIHYMEGSHVMTK